MYENPHFSAIRLDRSIATPLQRQLYDALREMILSTRLEKDVRLPSTRALAKTLNVSRNTVCAAFDQLAAEGFVEARTGAGTRVADFGDDTVNGVQLKTRKGRRAKISLRGQALTRTVRKPLDIAVKSGPTPFRPGVPDLAQFPHRLWARFLGRRARQPRPDTLGYSDPAGFMPLREALAGYLAQVRAVTCSPCQIIITSGAQAGLDLMARLLTDPGDTVWMEEPGYLGARAAFGGAHTNIVPVRVDAEGMDIQTALSSPAPKLIYVTPSHQFPTGATLSLARRLALLEFAARHASWVLEDDYDSEFRFEGRPLASLQGLDGGQRVVYLGTMSKVMLPALRIGYLVVPAKLVDPARIAIKNSGQMAGGIEQAALADFIAEGHFTGHIRRMRAIYAKRRAALHAALEKHGGGLLTPGGGGGLQLAAYLPRGYDDEQAAKLVMDAGIEAPALSSLALTRGARKGLFLGYGNVPLKDIPLAAQRLLKALH